MVSGVLAGTESLLLEMEIESTKEVLELYQQKLQSVQGKINNNTRSLAFRDQDFEYLLEWLDEAQLDRVGAFRFEPVEGAQANGLDGHVPEDVKEERYARIMERTAAISAAKLRAKVGRTLPVIIDEVGEPDEDGDIGATARSQADAPEIDGNVFLRNVSADLNAGDIVDAVIEDADAHDLFGVSQ